ncbi:MAG: hypothetical protein ACKVQW_03930 [Pyrinomonadaceae bacterium]
MKAEHSAGEALENDSSDEHGNGQVEIKINDDPYRMRRGQHRVVELKELGSVPQAHILAQVINGQLVDLANDAKVHIRGGEEFHSHADSGASS